MTISRKEYQNFTDEQLMGFLKRGEVSAFNELYERYSKRLLYYFYRMFGGNEEKAQDFLQELFLKVVDRPGRFHSTGRFSTWIFTVAHNMCKNEYRRLAVRKFLEHEADMDTVSQPIEVAYHNLEKNLDQKEFKKELLKELEKFDEDKRSTFLLRYQEDFSIKEISEILGCAEGTIKSRLFYTTKQLAVRLKVFGSLNLR